MSRDLDGFFDHVWTVHPFGCSDARGEDIGRAERTQLGSRHSFIQARRGRFLWLRRLPMLNFLLAQVTLVASLIALVRHERTDIVRAGDPLYVGLLGWMIARAGGATFAIRVNGNNDKVRETTGSPIYPRLLRSARVEKALERFLLPRAALVAAPNQDNLDFAVSNGANPSASMIFPYGNLLSSLHFVDPRTRGLGSPRRADQPEKSGPFLLCVSRLKAAKFPDDCVRALAAARAAKHDIRLVLAGEGEMREELEQLADQLGVAAFVDFPGNLDQATLAELYPRAAAVISPLTGRALSEAALGGAPIVAYDLDWQGDLVRSGESGILVPFHDQRALNAGTIALLEDPQEARRLGENARALAMRMFDPDRLLMNERAAYARLLGRTG